VIIPLVAFGTSASGGETDTIYQLDVVITALVVAVAIAIAMLVIVIARSEQPVEVGPQTLDTPPQTPAVAALLTHPQEVPGSAVAATVVDLAARGVFDVVDLGGGAAGIRLLSAGASALTAYESRVVDLVRQHANTEGIAPAGELAFADDKRAEAWLKGFREEVRREARAGGWVRPRYGREVALLLLVLVAMAAVIFVWGQATATKHSSAGPPTTPREGLRSALTLLAAALGAADVFLLFRLGTSASQRLTPTGRVLASRWLGVATHLRQDVQLERAPVAAVAIWHRLLAYATAFGVARTVRATLPVGPMSPTRAWSSATGQWRQVQVDYPRLWPLGWGQLPIDLFRRGFFLFFGVAFPAFVVGLIVDALASTGLSVRHAPLPVLLLAGVIIAAAASAMLYGLALLAAAAYFSVAGDRVIDTVVGTVVRVVPAGDEGRWLWVAVDTGRTNRIRAYASWIGNTVPQGGRAQLMVRRVDGRVVSIDPAATG
jgi:hypothetical protein